MDDNLTLQEMVELKRSEQAVAQPAPMDAPADVPEAVTDAPLAEDAPPEQEIASIEASPEALTELQASKNEDGFFKAFGKGIVNGTIKAGESMSKLITGVDGQKNTENIAKLMNAMLPEGSEFQFSDEYKLMEGESAVQDVTTALTQFGIGFYTGDKILKGAKLLQGAGKATQFANAMVKGVYSDFTSFKGDEDRLSDFLTQIDNPLLNNAVTQYLAGDPDDSDVEGRFKNVLEGAGLGVLTDTVLYTVKGLGKARKAMKNGNAEGATAFMNEARAKVGQILESNSNLVKQIDESTLDVLKQTRMNKNRAKEVLNLENATKIKDQIKSFKDWSGDDAYKYLDDTISGVVDRELFETTDDVATVMDFMSDVTVPDFDVWPHATRVEMARTYGMTVDQLQQLKDLGAVNSHALLTSKAMLQDQAAVVAKSIDDGLSDEQVLLEMTRYKDLSDIFLSFRNESGRVLDSNRIKIAMEEGDRDLIDDFVSERFGSYASFAKFKEAVKATGGDAGEMKALMQMSKAQIAAESVLELWKNSILSGIKTFNVNLIGSMANSTLQIPVRFFEGAAGAVRGGTDRVYMGEAAAMLAADTMSFVDLLHTSARMIKNPKAFKDSFSIPHAMRDKAEMGVHRKISADYWGMSTEAGSVARFVQRMTGDRVQAQTVQGAMRGAVDVTGSVINAPVSAINIQDGFIQNHAMRKQKFALAYRRLTADGYKGKEFAQKFYEMVNDPEFTREVAPELRQFAKRVTFQEEMGQLGKAVDNLAKTRVTPLNIPVFEYLMPFRRTPANIMKQGLGEVNPVIAPMTKEFRDKMSGKFGGVAKDEAVGRLMFGSSVATVAGSMVLSGNLTGAGPQDPEMRKAWLAAGNKPYSIRVQKGEDPNGNAIYESYEYGRIEPISFLIGSIASAIETHHFMSLINDRSEKTFNQYASAAITALSQATLDKSFFTGVNDFFLTMSDPQRYSSQFINRFGTSFVPNISRDMEMMLQDTVYLRDFREFENALNQKLIGKSGKVPVTRNRWGDPISKDKGWLFGHRTHFSPIGMDEGYAEDIDREINRLAVEGVAGANGEKRVFRDALLPMPDRAIIKGGTRVRLDAEQYSRLVEIAGKEIKLDNLGTGVPLNFRDSMNYLVNQSSVYKAAKDFPATQARLIKEAAKGYDEAARNQLIQEFPDLAKKVKDAEFLNLESTFGVMNEEMRMKLMELMGEELE